MAETSREKRFAVIDIARCYGITLVFYGHYIEELMLLKNPVAASHYKFIYSFHMLLFIVLAGYVAKEQTCEMSFRSFIRNRFSSRLIPYIFFTLLMIVPTFFFEGKFFNLDLPSFEGYLGGLIATIFGLPLFCIPSWFLLLIIGVELVHYSVFRFIKDSDKKILLAAVLFYVVGYFLNLKLDIFNPLKGRTIGWNYFFIHEAITLYSFYLIGIYMRRTGYFSERLSAKIAGPAALVAFAVVLFTYQLNTGPFNFHVYDAVVIIFASHGHFLLFPLTALAGSLMILFLAAIDRVPRVIVYMGQNTLVLMCLNGIFYHYINPPLAKWVLDNFGGSAMTITVSGVVTTIISLLMCVPFLYGFNRYMPGLIGKKKHEVPLQTGAGF
jgi:acyltransferase